VAPLFALYPRSGKPGSPGHTATRGEADEMRQWHGGKVAGCRRKDRPPGGEFESTLVGKKGRRNPQLPRFPRHDREGRDETNA